MRRARVPLVALLLLGCASTTVAAGPPARATTHDGEPTTLTVAIDDVKPLTPVETSTLTVTGKVTNPGTTAVSSLSLSLEDYGPAVTRADLDAFRTAPGGAAQTLVSKVVPRGLAAGATAQFVLSVPDIGELLGTPSRVYKLAVVADGAVAKGAPAAPLGLSGLPVPYFPRSTPISGSLRTALVIPMTEEPDQGPIPLPGATGPSRQLITDLGQGGRLDRLLSVIDRAPPAGGVGGTHITLAIDPALLDRVCALAGRCTEHIAVGTPQADTDLAGAWLSRLSAAVESPYVTVVGLPYADADVAAMTNAGATGAVVTLLQKAGGLVDHDLTSAATSDIQPLLPVDGLANDALASAAERAGSSVAVLSSSMFRTPEATADQPVTPTASTTLHTSAGPLAALVTDPVLQDLLAAGSDARDSPRLQEQNLLAELAVITSERPNYVSPQRAVVLEAPRDWDVDVDFATHLVDALADVSFVSSEGLSTLQNAPPVERTLVTPPPPPFAPLPAAAINTVSSERANVAALHAVAADRNETISPPYGEGLDRALSAWWRGSNAAAGASELAGVSNDLTTEMNKVTIRGGHNGVLLTGPSGMLPVQVSNLLQETVSLVVHVQTGGLDQVTGRDVPLHLGPGIALQQVALPITTRSTRDVDVTVQLLASSDTKAQIAQATIRVRSSSVGKVAVGITATALTFLVLLIVFRGVRRVAARRRGEPAA